MSFLAPAFLGALALIGVPLLIHLIRRRKLKVVQWAAMEFLRQSQKRQRRRLQIEELILLLLRMLIVAVAVLAFARPVLRALGVPLLSQNTRVYAIIALDNSLSMKARGRDGKESFARAKAAAERVLSQLLKPGDSVSLVLLSDKPDALVASPTFDLNSLRRRVQSLSPSDRGTDYFVAAQAVNKLLKASSAPVKEVYWITDDQANGWATSKTETAKAVWSEVGKSARLTWVSTGETGDRENIVVEPPTLAREQVTPQMPARIEARLVNYGQQPHNNLLVNLTLDGKKAGSTRVNLPANGSAAAQFPPALLRTPGTHTGQVTLEEAGTDTLPEDNTAPFAIRVRSQIRALVWDPRPASDPAKSESFYLMTALAPGGAAESVAPRLRENTSLDGVNLRGYDAVVLTGVANLSASDQRALSDYVRGGGGLLLFPGPATDRARLNTDLNTSGLLPAKLGPRRSLPEEGGITLNPATIAHPALSVFKDTTSLNLGGARFLTLFPLEPVTDDSDPNAVNVMLRFSDGNPAFVERKVGLGRVILAASGAGAVWNQLPLRASYVPLVYQLVSYLGQGPSTRRNLPIDEPFFLSLPLADANKPVRVTLPNGKIVGLNSLLDARGVTFTFGGTTEKGLYQVAVEGGKTTDTFAVGLPPAESDLRAAPPAAQLSSAGVPTNRLTVAENESQLEASVRRSRYGAEIWRPLIWLLLPLLFLESMLAQRFGRRG